VSETLAGVRASLARTCALLLVLLVAASSCAGPGSDPARDAAISAELEKLDTGLRDGDDAGVRNAAARLRELGARGADLQRADEALRLSNARIEPRLQPALDALRAALASGDDELARSVLRRLWSMGPTGAAADLANVYERILEGRLAVAGLDLRAECVWIPAPEIPGGGTCLVRLAARSRDGVERTLEPGPATLALTAITVDLRGASSQGSQTRSFDTLALVTIPAEGAAGVDLAQVPLELPEGALALRLTAEIRLRSGTVHEGDRTLPAQRVPVEHGELVLLAGRLLAQGAADPSDVVRRAADPEARRGDLLDAALRVRREDRERVLDALCVYAGDTPSVDRLTSALRWLAPDVQGGADAATWARWLADRGARLANAAQKNEPVLPRHLQPNLAGS
jgi:hypothetical protein